MLVLSRKRTERILIGENIELTVLEIRGNHVKLGLSAPPEIPIQREEIRHTIAAERDDRFECPQPMLPALQAELPY